MLTNVPFKLQSETVRRLRAIREESYQKTGSRTSDDEFFCALLDLAEKATITTKKGAEPLSDTAVLLNSLLNSSTPPVANV